MTEKRFEYYNHKGADYILDTPNKSLDFIEMLGDCLEAEEIVDLLNGLNDENKQLQTKNNAYLQDIEVYREENTHLKLENEQLKKVFRELITSGYWDDDYLTEQDWNDLKRYIENVFEKVMMND